jgi:hypothetical protein
LDLLARRVHEDLLVKLATKAHKAHKAHLEKRG